MNLFGNANPIYKGTRARPQATGGLFSGLFGSLIGGNAPSYKTVDGRAVNAQSSASWWQALSSTPSYKTAPTATEPAASAQEVMQRCDVPFADNGESGAEQTCVCAPEDTTQIVILGE